MMANKKLDDEEVKYIKRKPSNVSKAKFKARHKHEYCNCILKHDRRLYIGIYCSICGKLNNWAVPTKKTEYGYRMMNNGEILFQYNDLEIIEVDDLFAKYIPIEKNNEEQDKERD